MHTQNDLSSVNVHPSSLDCANLGPHQLLPHNGVQSCLAHRRTHLGLLDIAAPVHGVVGGARVQVVAGGYRRLVLAHYCVFYLR